MLKFTDSVKKGDGVVGVSFNNEVFILDLIKDEFQQIATTEKETMITHSTFGLTGNEIYIATTNKMLELWELQNSTWNFKSRITFKKKPLKIQISSTQHMGVVSDKFGTVFGFDLKDVSNKTLKSLMGHVSTVTDMLLSPKEDYLITGDHDEKIRVTCFPQTYEIHQFCLGHKGFISQLAIAGNILVSASKDGTLKSWNISEGKILDTFDLKTITATPLVSRLLICAVSRRVIVIIENLARIIVCKLQDWPVGQITVIQEIDLLMPPTSAILDERNDLIVTTWDKSQIIAKFHTVDNVFVRSTLSIPKIIQAISEKMSDNVIVEIQKKFSLEQYGKKDYTKNINNNNNIESEAKENDEDEP